MAKTNDNSGLGGIFSGINNLLEVVQELQKQGGNAEGGTQNFTTKSGLEGQTLKLEANGAAPRKYAKTLELSKAVKGEFTKSCQNGILELMVPFAG